MASSLPSIKVFDGFPCENTVVVSPRPRDYKVPLLIEALTAALVVTTFKMSVQPWREPNEHAGLVYHILNVYWLLFKTINTGGFVLVSNMIIF